MKKIISFEHTFLGLGLFPSSCTVEMVEHPDLCCITFVDTDQGTSVTNASELLANEISLMTTKCSIRYFERYLEYNTFDEITYTSINGKLCNPEWKSLTLAEYTLITRGTNTLET